VAWGFREEEGRDGEPVAWPPVEWEGEGAGSLISL
jgi:hypothetical protein